MLRISAAISVQIVLDIKKFHKREVPFLLSFASRFSALIARQQQQQQRVTEREREKEEEEESAKGKREAAKGKRERKREGEKEEGSN